MTASKEKLKNLIKVTMHAFMNHKGNNVTNLHTV